MPKVGNLARHVAGGKYDGSIDASSSFSDSVIDDYSLQDSLKNLKAEAAGQSNVKMGKKRSAQGNPEVVTKASKSSTPLCDEVAAPPPPPLNVVAAQDSSTRPNASPVTYIRTDEGPYKAIVSLKANKGKKPTDKPPMNVEVSRALLNMGVNFSLLERISRYKWTITFNDRSAANNAVNNKYMLDSKYSGEIPWYMVYRKVVIKEIPTDVPEVDILKELGESNPKLSFDQQGIFRLRTRTYVDGVATYVNSSSVRLNLRAAVVPAHVFMWRSRFSMTP